METKVLDFVKTFRPYAEQEQTLSGCLSTVLLAKFALETGWGTDTALMSRNNLSGIKNTHVRAVPGVYATFASLESFIAMDAELMKADCPYLNSVPIASQTPISVFTGSDWSTNPQYAQEVQAVWQDDILPAIAELDLQARLEAEPEPVEPQNEAPEPASADPNPPESQEGTEPHSEAPESSGTEPSSQPATHTPSQKLICTLPANPINLRNDAWDVTATFTGPTGKSWTGNAQLDTGAFETVMPGVPNGIAQLLDLPDLGSITIAGISGSAASTNSEVTITLTDPVSKASLQMPASPCVVDPSYDGLLIGAKVFIDRKITVEFDAATSSVSFWV